MPIEFRIEDEAVDASTHVVAVHGELDLFTVPEFKARIAAAVEAGATRVVVDLSDVSFIDSSSLGVLIGAHKGLVAESEEAGVVVVVTDKAIANTFKITGLDQVFEIVKDREAALAA